MKTDDRDWDQQLEAQNKARDEFQKLVDTEWLEIARGTYSIHDKRIFEMGFRRGYQKRRVSVEAK